MMTIHSRTLKRTVAHLIFAGVTLMLSGIPATARPSWKIPSLCTQGVDGVEEDNPLPIATLVANYDATRGDEVRKVTFKGDQTWAHVWIKKSAKNAYLVTVEYTPFLVSYWAISPQEVNNLRLTSKFALKEIQLPEAGYNNDSNGNPQYHLFTKATITIKDANQNLMRNAFVMFAPEFKWASPFSVKSDGNGVVEINCFTSRQDNNPVYVVSADGQIEPFDATLKITKIVPEKDGAEVFGELETVVGK
jgi:hypothetical protein